MKGSCEFIPKSKTGNDGSSLFRELLTVTGNDRATTKRLYGLYEDTELMRHKGISVESEPTAEEFLEKLGLEREAVGESNYPDYINKKEGLSTETHTTWSGAIRAAAQLRQKYQVPFIISETNGAYYITALMDTPDNREIEVRQQTLSNLNTRLLNYMQDLGFGVSEIDNVDAPGKFSPISAKKNAENLISIIQISKGEAGQEALPEEFSHFILEGTQSHPLVQRLLNYFEGNTELSKEVLGSEFESYDELYNGDSRLLAREAAAKLIAQKIADRSGLGSSISYISNKFLNHIQSIFKKGNKADIDEMVRETDNTADAIVAELFNDTLIEFFDPELLKDAPTLYRIGAKLRSVEEITSTAYETLSKRVKLASLYRPETEAGKPITKVEEKTLKELKKQLEETKYFDGMATFLRFVTEDIQKVYQELDKRKKEYESAMAKSGRLNSSQLKRMANTLKDIEGVISAYTSIVEEIQTLVVNPRAEGIVDDSVVEGIASSATQLSSGLKSLSAVEKDFRTTFLIQFYQRYWGEDKIIDGKTVTLRDIMESTVGDTNVLSRLINSMSDMPDPLLQLVDIAFKNATSTRDQNVMELQQRLGLLQQAYYKETGSRDTSFMYVFKDGKPTGMLKSDRDYSKYWEAMSAYRKQLLERGYSKEELASKMFKWRRLNTEKVGNEMMPKKSLYPSNDLDTLTAAQRKYYDEAMAIKEELDARLPKNRQMKYRAVQKQIEAKDAITKGKFKSYIKRLKAQFVKDADDTEYGESTDVEMKDGKYIITDFAGNEVKTIPVFYTKFLEDMSTLDTSFTDTLLSYGAMAYNYEAMNNIADIMELTASHMQDRDVKPTSGMKKMYERFVLKGEAHQKDYTISGADSELMKKLRNYLDSGLYSRKKNEEYIGNVNAGKLADALIHYNSLVGLGYNMFSGMTNVTMGMAQTLIHAVGGKNFGLKDVARAHIWYNKDLAGAIADQYSDIKDNKLALLLDKFDALEEYYETLNDENYYGGVFKKLVGKHSPLIFNSMGEHYLHSICMLAMMHNRKVKINGEDATLYDALKVEPIEIEPGKTINQIVIVDGATKLDGTALTEKDLQQFKLEMQNANHRMHGAFNQKDFGDMSKYAVGRLIKQYRQWMPAFFMDRFKSKRLNVVTSKEEEGFYITAAKLIGGLIKDTLTLKFEYAVRFKHLTDEEKSNIKMALSEISMLYLLILGLHWAGEPDGDDPWLVNALKYNGYRLKTELGAAAPTTFGFIDNWKTIIKSPLPQMEGMDRLINLLDVSTLGEEIQTGKYAGWNRWLRNAFFATPFARNTKRLFDLMEGDTSMFTPYISPGYSY